MCQRGILAGARPRRGPGATPSKKEKSLSKKIRRVYRSITKGISDASHEGGDLALHRRRARGLLEDVPVHLRQRAHPRSSSGTRRLKPESGCPSRHARALLVSARRLANHREDRHAQPAAGRGVRLLERQVGLDHRHVPVHAGWL